jgi:hypothetical protein
MTRAWYRLRRGREAAPLMDCLSPDHRSSKPLAVDLSDSVRVGAEGASRQDIALLNLQEVGVGVDSRDGGLDLLKLVVREAAAKEDGHRHLAPLLGGSSVGSETRARCDLEVAGEDGGQLGEGSFEIQARVDDLDVGKKLLADRLGDLAVTAIHDNGNGSGGGGHCVGGRGYMYEYVKAGSNR